MSLSKNVALVVASPASKKNRLFGLSREDLKLVRGATGAIVTSPNEEPRVPDSIDPVNTVLPLPLVP